MTLRAHVDRYVALKRHLGFKFLNNERMLRSWAAFAMTRGDDVIVADTMIGWARDASSPAFARKRLSVGRRFAVWLHAEDQRHEIPPNDVLGPTTRRRPAPHLLTNDEIRTLMAAALSLPPAGSITPHTWHCIIGLMATTGLRRCEVCALHLTDITPDGLVVRESKFQKSRLVPLLRSTVDALGRYLSIRQRCGGTSEHLFVLSTGRPINPDIVTGMFVKLARQVGLRGGPGEPGPRLHDLRHRFAVRSLEHAVATDRDSANRHMLALATYLGHNNVSSTYCNRELPITVGADRIDMTEICGQGEHVPGGVLSGVERFQRACGEPMTKIVHPRPSGPGADARLDGELVGGGGVQADQPALAELGLADDKSVRCDIGQPQGHGFAPPDPGRGDETQHVVPGERRDRPRGSKAQCRGEERAQLLRRHQVRKRALVGMRAEEIPWRDLVASILGAHPHREGMHEVQPASCLVS